VPANLIQICTQFCS